MLDQGARDERLESVDLVISLLELLGGASRPLALGEVARDLEISKSRAHRHLRALILNGYVRQDDQGDRYEITARLLTLAETARGRLSFGAVARPAMADLRDATGQTVTASAVVGGQISIVDLLRGRTLVQFAIRPGTVMDPQRSAHGLVALAFGPPQLSAGADAAVLRRVAEVRSRGWATAPGEIVTGVNALAAPVFARGGLWRGTVAIVGSIDVIAPTPAPMLIDALIDTTRRISELLGEELPS